MKCRNCGATYRGIACPVCGQKHLKKTRCSVCFTLLFPGQQTCPKCGSPTIYRQSHDIQVDCHTSSSTNLQHNNYDYNKNAYNYKKEAYHYNEEKVNATVMSFASIFDPLRQRPVSHKQSKNNNSFSLSGLIVLLLFIAFCIFSTMIFN